MVAGKDGIMRVLDSRAWTATRPRRPHRPSAAKCRRYATPGGGELFTVPAVWRHGIDARPCSSADSEGTAASRCAAGACALWVNRTPGTSPIVAGGLLYVYDPSAGGIEVYSPDSPRPLVKLPGAPGHWNSPIVVDGHVVEPEGDANEHELTGKLVLFSVR